MRFARVWTALLALAALGWAAAPAQAAVVAAWVQMTEAGAEVRAVVADAPCPEAEVDGRPVALTLRSAADPRFPAVCSAVLAPGARQVRLDGRVFQGPRAFVRRIVVFGDTGCRIKGPLVQACNDPKAWPFAEVARRAAARHPDLIVHVGDYYYRESPCPVGDLRCQGSPAGDRWAAWSADFFEPSAPLLTAAPWVFARGNHESCKRGGYGWFRLLDAAAEVKACPAEASAWRTPLGGLDLDVVDSADTEDLTAPAGPVKAFADQLQALQPGLGREPGWLLVHRPIWGLTPIARVGPFGAVNAPLNATEQAAAKGRDLRGMRMVLSGHVHDFASFDFDGARPAQLVVGTGGDVGQPADSPVVTRDRVWLDGMAAARLEFDRFGYMVLDRVGEGPDDWRGVFYDAQDRPVVGCALEGRRLACAPLKAVN